MSGARAFAAVLLDLVGAVAVLVVSAFNVSTLSQTALHGGVRSVQSAHVLSTIETVVAAVMAAGWLAFALWCHLRTVPRFAISTAWRVGMLAMALLWGWYFVSSFRTAGFGVDLRDGIALPVAAVAAVFPLAWAACVGRTSGNTFVFLIAIGAVLVGTEAWARAQEVIVVQRFGKSPYGEVVVRRWPPFSHHDIYFAHGEWHGRD